MVEYCGIFHEIRHIGCSLLFSEQISENLRMYPAWSKFSQQYSMEQLEFSNT